MKTLQIIVEIIIVDETVRRRDNDGDEATSSLFVLPNLLYSFFVFADILVAVILWEIIISVLRLQRYRKSFIQQRRAFYRHELQISPCETHLLKLTKWRAAIFKLA